jgi:hypothetical protein
MNQRNIPKRWSERRHVRCPGLGRVPRDECFCSRLSRKCAGTLAGRIFGDLHLRGFAGGEACSWATPVNPTKQPAQVGLLG